MLRGLITLEQFIFCAVLAFFLTLVYLYISKRIGNGKENDLERQYGLKEIEDILKRCYLLFPTDNLEIEGNIIKRGMRIRIITNQNKIFEGRFLGANDDEMLCLMTRKFIIAHAIQNIDYVEEISR